VTEKEAPDSLAEQAANWVPPWSRPPNPDEPDPDANEPPTAEWCDLEDDDAQEIVGIPVPAALTAADMTPELLRRFDRSSVVVEEGDWDLDVDDDDTDPVRRRRSPLVHTNLGDDPLDSSMPSSMDLVRQVWPEMMAGIPGPNGKPGAVPMPPLAPPEELKPALEAILMVVDQPVPDVILAQILGYPEEVVAATLSTMAEEYTTGDRGFELRKFAGGWRFYTRPAYAMYVERFVLDGQQSRLTQAALETLAVVAYKQPVTRSRMSAIRGVNCDGVVRTLVSRGLIEECGTEPESGAFLYRTTNLFLEKLGLERLDDLPPLAPFLPTDVDAIFDAQS
jgi:segregation and condensation protein B